MNHKHEHRLQEIITALQAASRSSGKSPATHEDTSGTIRFVTISRQAGAGGASLGEALANAINLASPQAEQWCSWDNELVSKVANEHHIPRAFIDALEDKDHSWLGEFISSLVQAEHPDDFKVFRRVAATIRALVGAGRAIIVGRGGVFVTASLTGGLHVRIVAPIEYRVQRTAERLGLSLESAAKHVHEIDRRRAQFYHQYWPAKQIAPETFSITLNAAQLTQAQMVAALVPIVLGEKVDSEIAGGECRWQPPVAKFATGVVHGGAR